MNYDRSMGLTVSRNLVHVHELIFINTKTGFKSFSLTYSVKTKSKRGQHENEIISSVNIENFHVIRNLTRGRKQLFKTRQHDNV